MIMLVYGSLLDKDLNQFSSSLILGLFLFQFKQLLLNINVTITTTPSTIVTTKLHYFTQIMISNLSNNIFIGDA